MSTVCVDWDHKLVYLYLSDDPDMDRPVAGFKLTVEVVADYDRTTGEIVGVEILNLPFRSPQDGPWPGPGATITPSPLTGG